VLPSVGEGRRVIALVGPAGVGKTTTAAKLAAHARMARKTVALVSCDAFRVGAMDQLGKYAELMDARFHTAATPEELAEIVRREDADVIIIDTSGRPIEPDATEAQLGAPELRNERSGRRVEVLLCVPASLRASDATRVHRDFARAAPTALVVTKVDETDAPAGIAHAVFATRLPLSVLCAGQCVPEDIAPATDEAVADLLFPEALAKKARER
jgi:flagellar biosynthesis protein FlhF